MKNISSIQKSNKFESPKTPGGISRSLLTPCRRVGLSRNWRKSGSSPFVSPLANNDNSPEVKQKPELKKRKCSDDEAVEITENTDNSLLENTSCHTPRAIDSTRIPSRNTLARKKSKTLVLVKEFAEENKNEPNLIKPNILNISTSEIVDTNVDELPKNDVAKLFRTNSKSESKTQKSPVKSTKSLLVNECVEENDNESINLLNTPESHVDKSPKNVKVAKLSRVNSKNKSKTQKLQECVNIDIELNKTGVNTNTVNTFINKIQEKKSPENLTKECMVVIQKKLFKTDNKNMDCDKAKTKAPISQVLFDSDSDDIPLSNLHSKTENQKVSIGEDDEFQEKKLSVQKIKKVPSIELKNINKVKDKIKPLKNKTQVIATTESKESLKPTEAAIDEDDDFVCDKKTILIKKTYSKVTKPSKAKSTGSVTQKDIDELMARIEAKKNLFLAKSMTNETMELRNLIKKWQKGCQDALTELLELMKTKMPDKNMNYTEILDILKIPPDLVGYDSENDCFHTPDDSKIVLSEFNI